jgi:hypothetical protein
MSWRPPAQRPEPPVSTALRVIESLTIALLALMVFLLAFK